MLKLIATTFWPALVPLALYALWMFRRKRLAKKANAVEPHFTEGPWWWAVIASLLLAIACFVALGLSNTNNTEATYTPKRFDGGQLSEGDIVP